MIADDLNDHEKNEDCSHQLPFCVLLSHQKADSQMRPLAQSFYYAQPPNIFLLLKREHLGYCKLHSSILDDSAAPKTDH